MGNETGRRRLAVLLEGLAVTTVIAVAVVQATTEAALPRFLLAVVAAAIVGARLLGGPGCLREIGRIGFLFCLIYASRFLVAVYKSPHGPHMLSLRPAVPIAAAAAILAVLRSRRRLAISPRQNVWMTTLIALSISAGIIMLLAYLFLSRAYLLEKGVLRDALLNLLLAPVGYVAFADFDSAKGPSLLPTTLVLGGLMGMCLANTIGGP